MDREGPQAGAEAVVDVGKQGASFEWAMKTLGVCDMMVAHDDTRWITYMYADAVTR